MASVIVGITGRKRAGKDTFARRLIDEHGFTRVAFADAVRETALAVDPWVRVEQDEHGLLFGPAGAAVLGPAHWRLSEVVDHIGWESAKDIREVRRLLQVIGTEAGRQLLGENVWVDIAARKAAAVDGPVVITDVRFPNEAEWVWAQRGVIVRVQREQQDTADTHASEVALDDWTMNMAVDNNATVSDLHAHADAVARTLLGD